MGQELKTIKGEIAITNCDGRIRLRWRHAGTRYSLSLPFAYKPENIHHATVKLSEIKLDMLKGCFDETLKRYEYRKSVTPGTKKLIALKQNDEAKDIRFVHQLAVWFTDWGKHIRNVDVDNFSITG